ncbi:MAG: chemotaxis protein CheB [Actinobacteria bacterium]|nr:chemotaxis protein CheB [Actinomycetota bacterium]
MFDGGQNESPTVVVIIGSAGAMEPLSELIAVLPEDFPAPIVIHLHRSPGPTDPLHSILSRRTTLTVRPVGFGAPIDEAALHLVAAGTIARFGPDRSMSARPGRQDHAGDALFESAASAYGRGVCAVVLSGRLDDGTRGARTVKRHGGRVIAQHPATAAEPSMPTHAIATGCVDLVLPPRVIGSALVALTMAPGMAEFLRIPIPAWASLT